MFIIKAPLIRGDYLNILVKEKLFPSNKPLSLNLSSGITSSAINDKVINGALNVEPSACAALSIS
jgi:hypothetical protein